MRYNSAESSFANFQCIQGNSQTQLGDEQFDLQPDLKLKKEKMLIKMVRIFVT